MIMAVSSSSWSRSEVTGLVKSTHVQHVSDGVESDGSRLLGLGGLAVQRVDRDAFGGRVVHVETAEESASACPSCGVFSTSVKGQATTRPRDIRYGTAPLRLVWHKRRWRCAQRLCPRGSFTESLPAVPAPKPRSTDEVGRVSAS